MLFKRKHPMGWWERTRISLWPRRSWSRSSKYIVKRILRLTGSPHAIAAGVAAGVFTSFTPFIGLHFLFAALLAYVIAGNMLASALGTFFGNPLSFPLIWTSTYATGTTLLDTEVQEGVGAIELLQSVELSRFWTHSFGSGWEQITNIWDPVIKPMLLGAVPLGLPVAIVVYFLTRWLTEKYQNSRMEKLRQRANENAMRGGNASQSSVSWSADK